MPAQFTLLQQMRKLQAQQHGHTVKVARLMHAQAALLESNKDRGPYTKKMVTTLQLLRIAVTGLLDVNADITALQELLSGKAKRTYTRGGHLRLKVDKTLL